MERLNEVHWTPDGDVHPFTLVYFWLAAGRAKNAGSSEAHGVKYAEQRNE